MQYLLISLIVWAAATVMPAPAWSSQEPDPAHQVAYRQWRRAMAANPHLGDAFWLSSDSGPLPLRSAVGNLVSFGPNLIPFIVQEFRTETDRFSLYLLMLLLNRVSGINLYYDSGHENFYNAAPELTARFLNEWDSGQYGNATVLLRTAWKNPDPANVVERIDPRSISAVRRYGVYAIPFIAESLQKRDSPELFAAFLIITDQADVYARFLENPSQLFPTRDEKQAFVKAWAARNAGKLDKLKDLHENIRSLASR